jgi:hypothetical protein
MDAKADRSMDAEISRGALPVRQRPQRYQAEAFEETLRRVVGPIRLAC